MIIKIYLKKPTGRRTVTMSADGVAFSRHITEDMTLSGALPALISLALRARWYF